VETDLSILKSVSYIFLSIMSLPNITKDWWCAFTIVSQIS